MVGALLIFPRITDNLMMAEIPAWVSALKISNEDYLEWIATFPSPEFLLSWAIESKRVDEKAYIKWATSHYKLPVVKPDFFQKNPPPLELWKKYIYGPWSPTVLPLYEYKETLFVGVLEPKNFSLAQGIKVQLVLSPSALQSPWWHIYAQLRKELIPPTPPPEPAKVEPPPLPPVAEIAPPAVIVPPPPPVAVAPPPPKEKEQTSSAVGLSPEDTKTNITGTGRGVFVIERNDKPATPLGLEDHEVVQEEQYEYRMDIVSPNPAAQEGVPENTGAFAKVSAKPLEGAPESVAHALEILKAARQANTKPPPEFDKTLPPVVAPPVVAPPVATPAAAAPPVVEPPVITPPMVAPISIETVSQIIAAPPPVATPPPPPPPVTAPPITQLASELLKPEKKLDLAPEVTQSKITRIKTSSSRPDNSIGFDNLVAPMIKDNISPDGISFDLTSIAPPPPAPEKVATDDLPEGISGGLELIDKSPRSVLPEGLTATEVPMVELGRLENLVSDEREVELPELDFEKQQSLVDDLITAVRNTTLSPTHQGSTPPPPPQATSVGPPSTPAGVASRLGATTGGPTVTSVGGPIGAPPPPPGATTSGAPGAPTGGRPSVTAPGGQHVEEIVFTGVPEGSIKAVLDKLKSVFERGMVLLRQEGRLRPYQWDPSWPLDVTEKGEVELALNSLFKIVIESKHPFHGTARPAMPNDRFFKKWNKNQYPPHVTALPLKAHDEVFGVLLAIATAEKAPTIILQDWEKVAAELSADLAKQIGAAA